MGFTGKTADESEGVVEFFLRMKGRRGSFWMPTWQADVQPSATPLAQADRFQIDGQDFRDAYTDHPVFSTMVAFWDDGSFQINRLTSILGSTDSTLEFQYDWVNPIMLDTRIMWMALWRFDTDTLDVRWLTDSVAEMQFPVKTTYTTGSADFEIFDCPVLSGGGVFDPPMEPVQWGTLNLQAIPPYLLADVVDLYALGISQEDIDAGKILAAAKWEGLAQTGTPLVDDDTQVYLGIKFHATNPDDWYHSQISGAVQNEPGVYGFRCKEHSHHGMFALVVVGSPDPNLDPVHFNKLNDRGKHVFGTLFEKHKVGRLSRQD